MKTLFMIPARSGSKGLKDKNIKKLNRVPLMGHVINAIKETRAYSEGGYIFVNTDSHKYAEIANELGANTPFIRPDYLATDTSPVIDTIKHTFEEFEKRGYKFDLFALIQATSPLTCSKDIDRAIDILRNDKNINSVISVTEVEHPPIWCNTLKENLSMKDFIPKEIRKKNRQELPKYYRITGAIRVVRWDEFKNNNFDWYFDDSKALIVDRKRSIDIDTEDDFLYAQFLMERMKKDA